MISTIAGASGSPATTMPPGRMKSGSHASGSDAGPTSSRAKSTETPKSGSPSRSQNRAVRIASWVSRAIEFGPPRTTTRASSGTRSGRRNGRCSIRSEAMEPSEKRHHLRSRLLISALSMVCEHLRRCRAVDMTESLRNGWRRNAGVEHLRRRLAAEIVNADRIRHVASFRVRFDGASTTSGRQPSEPYPPAPSDNGRRPRRSEPAIAQPAGRVSTVSPSSAITCADRVFVGRSPRTPFGSTMYERKIDNVPASRSMSLQRIPPASARRAAIATATRTSNPNSGSIEAAATSSRCASSTDGGWCSRCGCDGGDTSLATLRPTRPHRSPLVERRRDVPDGRGRQATRGEAGVEAVDVVGGQLGKPAQPEDGLISRMMKRCSVTTWWQSGRAPSTGRAAR